MNLDQKIVTAIGMVLVAASIVFAPWELSRPLAGAYIFETKYAPVFMPPPPDPVSTKIRLRIESLCFEWLALGAIYTGAFFIAKSEKVAEAEETEETGDEQV